MCPYAQKGKGYRSNYLCTKTGKPCCYQRWCSTEMNYKLTTGIKTCSIRMNNN